MDKAVKINESLYQSAERIAAEKGIKLGDAVVEAAKATAPIVPRCTEEGFRAELAKAGLKAPRNVGWMFSVLDFYTGEMVKGTKFEPYFRAKEIAESKCEFLAAAEEGLESELAPSEEVSEKVSETED